LFFNQGDVVIVDFGQNVGAEKNGVRPAVVMLDNVFSPNVQISGSVKVGNANTFGFNSGVIQNCTIGDNNKFGVGAILLRNANNGDNYMGNPAIKMKF